MAKNLVPHLVFENSKTAIAYYETVFGATDSGRMVVTPELAAQFGKNPDDAHLSELTVHGSFHIFGQPIYFADDFGGNAVQSGLTFLLAATEDDDAAISELEAIFEKAENSGRVTVQQAFTDAFWGGKFGVLVDEYGITWQFAVNPQI
ncbi:VOC family protein [Lactococcus nasutitermitis]|uniref:VOC family protein n=1 Tax=Lactococcus nasutitermitis TaxID=1652957 RepID=A0ABV9JEE0_9LACT|nr:VOC family protein [Lactococcus nasutitermitis]